MSDKQQMEKRPTQKTGDELEARSLAIESLVQADFSREWINGNDAVQRELGRFAAEYATQLSSDRKGVQHAADELAQEWKQREQKEFVREVERPVEVPKREREKRPAVPEPRGEVALEKINPEDAAESKFYLTRSSTADKTDELDRERDKKAEFTQRTGIDPKEDPKRFKLAFRQEQIDYRKWRKDRGGAEPSDALFAQFLDQDGVAAAPKTELAREPVKKTPQKLDETAKDLLANYGQGTEPGGDTMESKISEVVKQNKGDLPPEAKTFIANALGEEKGTKFQKLNEEYAKLKKEYEAVKDGDPEARAKAAVAIAENATMGVDLLKSVEEKFKSEEKFENQHDAFDRYVGKVRRSALSALDATALARDQMGTEAPAARRPVSDENVERLLAIIDRNMGEQPAEAPAATEVATAEDITDFTPEAEEYAKEHPPPAAPVAEQEEITLAKIHEALGGPMPRTPIESLETKENWLGELKDTYGMKEQDYVDLVAQESTARKAQMAEQPPALAPASPMAVTPLPTPVAIAPEKKPTEVATPPVAEETPKEEVKVAVVKDEGIVPIAPEEAAPVAVAPANLLEQAPEGLGEFATWYGKLSTEDKEEYKRQKDEAGSEKRAGISAELDTERPKEAEEEAPVAKPKPVEKEEVEIAVAPVAKEKKSEKAPAAAEPKAPVTVAPETKGPQDDAKKRALRAALMTPMDSNRKLVGGTGPKVEKAEKGEISLAQLQRDARSLEGDLHRLDGFETELKEETAKWKSIKDKDPEAALRSSARIGEIRTMINPINKTIRQFEADYAALEATGANMKKGLGTGEYIGTNEREDIRTPAEMMRRINIRKKEGA